MQMQRRDFIATSAAAVASASLSPRDHKIITAVDQLKPWLIEQRRDFHMYPELMYQEVRTAKVVADRLRKLGLEDIKTGIAKTGVTALIKGGKPGPVVALRADMDALPIDESKFDKPYKSKNPGVKHACGHDSHTTMLLGVAEVLQSMRSEIPGTVKFIFQPAEEGGRGAQKMIDDGALENPRPSAIFGQHVWPAAPTGHLQFTPGAFMASGDFFTITIKGKSAHGARPEEGIDAVFIASQCVSALQAIRSRRIATADQMVFTIGSINGGTAANIIADTVELKGTLRTLNGPVRDQAVTLMHQTLDGVTKGLGGSYSMDIQTIGTVTYNEPKLVDQTVPTFRRILGDKNVVQIGAQMVAEDFSFYQQVIPGFFYFMGVRNEAKGTIHPVHTPEFDIDEDVMPLGVKVMASAALDYLANPLR